MSKAPGEEKAGRDPNEILEELLELARSQQRVITFDACRINSQVFSRKFTCYESVKTKLFRFTLQRTPPCCTVSVDQSGTWTHPKLRSVDDIVMRDYRD